MMWVAALVLVTLDVMVWVGRAVGRGAAAIRVMVTSPGFGASPGARCFTPPSTCEPRDHEPLARRPRATPLDEGNEAETGPLLARIPARMPGSFGAGEKMRLAPGSTGRAGGSYVAHAVLDDRITAREAHSEPGPLPAPSLSIAQRGRVGRAAGRHGAARAPVSARAPDPVREVGASSSV